MIVWFPERDRGPTWFWGAPQSGSTFALRGRLPLLRALKGIRGTVWAFNAMARAYAGREGSRHTMRRHPSDERRDPVTPLPHLEREHPGRRRLPWVSL